jgi:hypothetical protein
MLDLLFLIQVSEPFRRVDIVITEDIFIHRPLPEVTRGLLCVSVYGSHIIIYSIRFDLRKEGHTGDVGRGMHYLLVPIVLRPFEVKLLDVQGVFNTRILFV